MKKLRRSQADSILPINKIRNGLVACFMAHYDMNVSIGCESRLAPFNQAYLIERESENIE